MKNLDAILKARAAKIPSVVFDLVLDADDPDGTISAKLSMPDVISIQKEQTLVYESLLADCIAKGFGQKPPNMIAWQDAKDADKLRIENEIKKMGADKKTSQEIADYKEKAMKVHNSNYEKPPKNLAVQTAEKLSFNQTGIELVPKFLLDPVTNERLFKTDEMLATFVDIVKSDADLIALMSNKFVELVLKTKEIKKTAKNL